MSDATTEVSPVAWDRITPARARVLATLERQMTEPEAAASLGVSINGFRSHVLARRSPW